MSVIFAIIIIITIGGIFIMLCNLFPSKQVKLERNPCKVCGHVGNNELLVFQPVFGALRCFVLCLKCQDVYRTIVNEKILQVVDELFLQIKLRRELSDKKV